MPVSPALVPRDPIASFRAAIRRIEATSGHDLPHDEHEFPSEALLNLTKAGALSAVLPVEYDGLDLHGSHEGILALAELLRCAGRISLSLGRCLEGHINVIRLVSLYGTPQQNVFLAERVRKGVFTGVWVTDGPEQVALTRDGALWRLVGKKGFASGVHEVGLALITATTAQDETLMMLVPTGEQHRIGPGPGHLTGMAGSDTGSYDFTGVTVPETRIIGRPGDYLRPPEFSAGAWRGSAVALGGMDRLVELLTDELRLRHRTDNPHQQVRVGEALILRETAALWVRRAACAACAVDMEPGDAAAVVNLARIAVEKAALELVTIVQRGLGVMAFLRGKPVERIMRDLATYLRQPAPDETLTEAAAWFMTHEWPEDSA